MNKVRPRGHVSAFVSRNYKGIDFWLGAGFVISLALSWFVWDFLRDVAFLFLLANVFVLRIAADDR